MRNVIIDVNKSDAHGPTRQVTLLTICSNSGLGEVKTENVDSSANKPVHTVVIKANSTPAFSFRLTIFSCANMPILISLPVHFHLQSTKQAGTGSRHHCMTKYYSLMGELASSTVILAVNTITDPTLFTDQPEISICEGLVSD